MEKKNKHNKKNEDGDAETTSGNSKCNRRIQELRDALDLDNWKSLAQMPLDGTKVVRSVVSSQTNGNLLASEKRPPPEVVVYEDPRKRRKKGPTPVTTVNPKVKMEKFSSEKNANEFNIRKAQNEVQRLAISGMNKLEKEEAKIALAVKLGAKPPKNKYYNYKELIAMKKQQQYTTEASLALDKDKFPKSHRGGQKRPRRDKNDVRAFDSQVGHFRDGVQVIKKNDLFRMKKARRKTRT